MLSSYGVKFGKWEAAKAEARTALVECARTRSTITAAALVERVEALAVTADDPRLVRLLDEIDTEEDRAGRGLLSAVVVGDGAAGEPGPGFAETAGKLGRDVSDPVACRHKEVEKLYEQWS